MEDLKKYKEIIAKYQLDKQADEVADLLVGGVSDEALAKKFSMTRKEAQFFLKFIEKAVKYRKQYIV